MSPPPPAMILLFRLVAPLFSKRIQGFLRKSLRQCAAHAAQAGVSTTA